MHFIQKLAKIRNIGMGGGREREALCSLCGPCKIATFWNDHKWLTSQHRLSLKPT